MPTTTDNNESESPRGSKSLQDLAAVRLLEDIIDGLKPEQTIATLDGLTQSLVLSHLWKDYRRLLDLEDRIEAYCPTADRQLWAQSLETIDNPQWPPGRDNRSLAKKSQQQDPENGFKLSNEFGQARRTVKTGEMFRIIERDGAPDVDGTPKVRWNGGHLRRPSLNSPLKFCCKEEYICTCTDYNRDYVNFNRVISAQLLLYRLISVYHRVALVTNGVGQLSNSRWESTWFLRLVRVGEEGSRLEFRDDSGGPCVRFQGSEAGSAEALRLINWLVSDNVPVAPDGTIAGRYFL